MWKLVAGLSAVFVAPAAHAAPDDADIRRIVRAAYADFVNPDAGVGQKLRPTRRLEATERECRAMQARIDTVEDPGSAHGECSEDYEILCQCQDTGGVNWARIGIAVRFPAPDLAEAALTFKRGSPNLKLVFARTKAGWALDDYWEYGIGADGGEASYRKRLGASIARMRTRLKLAPWTPPAP